jgi:Skp family chaperone for outer membrane proteins
MKMTRMLAAILAFGLLVAHSASAQEKPKPTEEARPITPVKVQVLFTEFEGEKKISSLP